MVVYKAREDRQLSEKRRHVLFAIGQEMALGSPATGHLCGKERKILLNFSLVRTKIV
jgi:hypothetical protein